MSADLGSEGADGDEGHEAADTDAAAGTPPGAPAARHRVWDCHTDVLSRLLVEPVVGFRDGRGNGPERHYDLDRIVRGGVCVMVCALFCRDDTAQESPVARTLRMIDNAHQIEALTEGRVAIARTTSEIDAIVAAGNTALVLSIENGVACLDKLELLRTYYRLGVRAIGLTWNGRNAIADGCGVESAGSKLTPFGRDLVATMGELGMVVDVSHLSESGFWDLLDRHEGPLIASHSNVRAFTDHVRNLKDAQIEAIAARGGVIGVNFYRRFLREQPPGTAIPVATIDDLVRHVHGLLERAGPDHVGMGSDFDGIGYGPEGVVDPAGYPALRARLASEGVAEDTLEKLFYGNFRRVFAEVLR